MIVSFRRIVGLVAFSFLAAVNCVTPAHGIEFTVDDTLSNVNVNVTASIFSASDSSSISGLLDVDLTPSSAPFTSAEVTALDLTLDEAMSFNLVIVSASTTAGGVSISQLTSGGAATVTDGEFSQIGNTAIVSGTVTSSLGDVILADQGPQNVDYPSAILSQTGATITLTAPVTTSITAEISPGVNATIDIDGTVVATALAFKIGDLDFDGDVDLTDFDDFFIPGWRTDTSQLTPEEAWAKGDMDLNGITELLDFGLFRDAYNAENPGASITLAGLGGHTVPEPATVFVAISGLLAFTALRRRR
ncbi:MAG: hypothetical protein ACR2NU_07310 [Aeoliella sp.]